MIELVLKLFAISRGLKMISRESILIIGIATGILVGECLVSLEVSDWILAFSPTILVLIAFLYDGLIRRNK